MGLGPIRHRRRYRAISRSGSSACRTSGSRTRPPLRPRSRNGRRRGRSGHAIVARRAVSAAPEAVPGGDDLLVHASSGSSGRCDPCRHAGPSPPSRRRHARSARQRAHPSGWPGRRRWRCSRGSRSYRCRRAAEPQKNVSTVMSSASVASSTTARGGRWAQSLAARQHPLLHLGEALHGGRSVAVSSGSGSIVSIGRRGQRLDDRRQHRRSRKDPPSCAARRWNVARKFSFSVTAEPRRPPAWGVGGGGGASSSGAPEERHARGAPSMPGSGSIGAPSMEPSAGGPGPLPGPPR